MKWKELRVGSEPPRLMKNANLMILGEKPTSEKRMKKGFIRST
jgi:hypothetical protein